MTFLAIEKSLQQASPDELYRFRRGVTNWFYNAGLSDVLYLGNTYTPFPIERDAIVQTKELNRNNIVLRVPRNFDVIQSFIHFPPTEIVEVEIVRRHREDTANEFSVIWNGRIVNIEWKGTIAEVICESAFTSIRRPGIHRHYQSTCPHALYGNQCRVNQQLFRDTDTVSGISGTDLTIVFAGTRADGYYDGGFLVYTDADGVVEKRMITSHVGTTVSLMAAIESLTVGASVEFFAGCKHDLDDCENKFSNLDNYGGFPFTPPFTPFGGTTIF